MREGSGYHVIGHLLRACRLAQGWSQNALAKKVGVTQPHLWNVENGERELSEAVAQRIAGVLGVPLSVFWREDKEVRSA